jgi:hypothetical protein
LSLVGNVLNIMPLQPSDFVGIRTRCLGAFDLKFPHHWLAVEHAVYGAGSRVRQSR